MKSYKQYSCLFIAIIGLFVILNFICWHFFTSQSFEAFEHTGHGDILRMGGLPYIVSHTGQSPYSYHHTGFWEYLDGGEEGHFDIITIGDSFSNDGGGAYYQDILSSEYGYSILNMPERLDAISTLYVLNERGYIDKIKPKVIILESAESNVQRRFGGKIIESDAMSSIDIANLTGRENHIDPTKQMPGMMVRANLRYINSLYHMKDNRGVVIRANLICDAFTPDGHENELLFSITDMKYMQSKIDTDMVNENFNRVAALMHEKGIEIVFFVAPNKLNLYYPFLDEEYKSQCHENEFFDKMCDAKKEYIFMDTRALLRNAVMRGEKDIYWYDDSHWSWKAQQIFCDALAKELEKQVT